MNLSYRDQRNIRDVIKTNHTDKYYKDLEDIQNISKTFIEHCEKTTSHEDIHTHVMQYVHYSEEKTGYYFYTKKKKTTEVSNVVQTEPEKLITKTEETKNTPADIVTIMDAKNTSKKRIKINMVDTVVNNVDRRTQTYERLRQIVLPVQRSVAWFAMREGKITASDGGTALGLNDYEQPYKLILKKITDVPFESNKFCYHGTKYEEIAALIYQDKFDVLVTEFGLMGHSKYHFLGASPDGICSPYRLDGVHKSDMVGTMLEIKCPVSRKIVNYGPIRGGICPIYYWAQVQLQLECCDLDECDFWQCSIYEYFNRDDYMNDAGDKPYLSKTSNLEQQASSLFWM